MLRAAQVRADAAGDVDGLVAVTSTVVRAGRGRPLAFVVPGGNTNDCARFTAVMEAIRVPRIGPGRPGVRPDHILGDKGYSSKAIRTWLRRRGIPHTIPERAARRPSTARHMSTATSRNGASTG
nr:transposase [Streptomyces sp. CB01883]